MKQRRKSASEKRRACDNVRPFVASTDVEEHPSKWPSYIEQR